MEIERVTGKVFEERAGFPLQYGPERTDHQPGLPFSPHEVYRDFVTIFLLVAIMFFLTGVATPLLGPSANPGASTPIIVPDWYVLFSYGLLRISGVIQEGLAVAFDCPNVCSIPGPLGPINLDSQFLGTMLSGIPFIFLLILPFIDRGRETRPAKAPFRSAFGIAFLIVFLFTTSVYAINALILERFPVIGGDVVLQQLILWPPILAGIAAYVGLRRLGYADMYWYRVIPLVGALLIFVAYSGYLAFYYRASSFLPAALVCLALLGAFIAVPAFAVTWTPETKALKWTLWSALILFIGLVALSAALAAFLPATWNAATWMLAGNMNVIIALPGFALIVAYIGLRRPYSTYEFLLNECYQCGKCHEVCPVTKVEDDALGGLNLVYNTFKKQHDGVPLWTCLACDACSAVCPLDIKYSDYILEERSKVLGTPAADGGSRIRDDR